MRHHRAVKAFSVGTALLGIGVMVTAVIHTQQGNLEIQLIFSYLIWLLYVSFSMMVMFTSLKKRIRFQLFCGFCSLLFLVTFVALGQREVDTDDSLAVANRVLTAVSTISMTVLSLLVVQFRHKQMKVNLEVAAGKYLRLSPQPQNVKTHVFWNRFPAHYFVREGVRPDVHMTYELHSTALQQQIGAFLPADEPALQMFQKEIQNSWPGIGVAQANLEVDTTMQVEWLDLELKEDDKFPLYVEAERLRFKQASPDKLSGLLSAIQIEDGEGVVGIQLLLRIAPNHVVESWRSRVNQLEVQLSQRGSKTVGNIDGTSRQSTTFGPQNIVQLQQELQALKPRIGLDDTYYEVVIRIWAGHPDAKRVSFLKGKAVKIVCAQMAGMNKLQPSHRKGADWRTIIERPFLDRGGFIMTGRELEATFHMPTVETACQHPLLKINRSGSLPPQAAVIVHDRAQIAGYIAGQPANVPSVRVYGRYQRGSESLFIGHAYKHTHDHLLVTGATGSGKSVLAQNVIFQDWLGRNSVLVIDPHGTLISDVLSQIPLELEDKVLILDPQSQTPFKYNICQIGKAFGIDRTVDNLMEAMKVAMGVSWESSVGMQQILRNAFILGLASDPDCDMVHVLAMLDPQKRAKALKTVKKTAVGTVKMAVTFWEAQFPTWEKNAQSRAVGAAERRISVFVQSAAIRRTLGSRGESIDLENAINSGQLILAPMANLGEETKRLWSAILVREVINILMRREETYYCSTTLLFDEMKSSIGTLGGYVQTIVEELRKYKASGAFFAQSFSQLPDDVVAALKVNCRTQVILSTGADDAKIGADILGEVRPSDIQNLPAYHAYAKVSVGGAQEKPCLIELLPPKQREVNPQRLKIDTVTPNGVYEPQTKQLSVLTIEATDYEIVAYLNRVGGSPKNHHASLLFLKNLSVARVENLLWIQKNTMAWMCRCIRENPGLLPKEKRIRLITKSKIGTPWWWSDYLFEKPQSNKITNANTASDSVDIFA